MAGTYVILYHKSTLLAERIRKLLNIDSEYLIEVADKTSLWEVLSRTRRFYRVLVADVDGEKDDGISLLSRAARNAPGSGVVVMSSNSNRDFLIRCVRAGVTDFICKPFEDKAFLNKVSRHLVRDQFEDPSEVPYRFDFSRYLRGELRKAEKGGYPVSLMFLTYVFEGVGEPPDPGAVDRFIYDDFSGSMWDTDVFVCLSKKQFIGVFPFCTSARTMLVAQKLRMLFERMKGANIRLHGCRLCSSFATFPNEAPEPGMLARLLEQRAAQETHEPIELVF